jgi:bifunctional non-homologous end joining protein LigD
MKAESGDLPPEDGRWAYEIKWDGMRVLATVTGGRVRLRGGRGTDVTVTFPELASLPDAVATDCVLDGEVVAFSDAGVPSFGLLQQRMHVTDAGDAARRARTVPVAYMAFDVLSVDGRSTLSLPYAERRSLLDDLVSPTAVLQVPPSYPSDGADLLEAARVQGLEGVVAKRVDSPYEPGRRSRAWRKVKVRHAQEFVVGGWIGGTGTRARTMGSLVLGCHTSVGGGGRALRWVGNVGSGFTDPELRRLAALLGPLAADESPFVASTPDERPRTTGGKPILWVRPDLVVQVEFGEWTSAGRLRHPVYLGQRDDKAAIDVTCDP